MLRRFLVSFIILSAAFGLALDAKAIAISPLKQHITLAPGTVGFNVTVTVRNEEAEKGQYLLKVLGAKQLENGAIVYGQGNSPAESWVKPEANSIEIDKDGEANVNFLINVPTDALAGSYILGLAAETGAGESSANVGVSAQVASVLLLQVEGSVKESLVLEKFDLPAVTFGREWSAIVGMQNIGTTELPLKGTILVRDWLGRELLTEDIDFGQVLLPGSGRGYTSKLNLKNKFLLPGPYNAELTVTYGLTQQKTYKADGSWHLPLYFWIIILAIIVPIIYKIFRQPKG